MSGRPGTVAVVLVTLVLLPRGAHAGGIGELIWEMSGPQMLGVLVDCTLTTEGTLDLCTFAGRRFAGRADPPQRPMALELEGGLYVSTGKNVERQDYEFGDVWMVAFDPMIQVQSVAEPFILRHGVIGVSYNLFFGGDFDEFANVAFKVRPAELVIGRFEIAYNLRLYPNAFTRRDFGRGPAVAGADKAEVVQSVSVGYRF